MGGWRCFESVDVLLADGTFETWYKDQMNFSYRHSAIQDQPAIVLSATFKLTPGDYDQIENGWKNTELRDWSVPLSTLHAEVSSNAQSVISLEN